MKHKTVLFALLACPAFLHAQSGEYVLNGKIDAVNAPVKVYLNRMIAEKIITDSAVLKNGAFQFKGTVTEPTVAMLILDQKGTGISALSKDREADRRMLYLEKGTIQLTGTTDVRQGKITGSPINKAVEEYQLALAPGEQALTKLNSDYMSAGDAEKNDKTFMAGLTEQYEKIMAARKTTQQQFVKDHPKSFFSLEVLRDLAGNNMDVAAVEPLYNLLAADLRNSDAGKALGKTIEQERKLSIGALAPDFTQNDVNDKPVKLSDFKGKYVLLDFWASWCGPCRRENPNVVKAYNQYKDKNFTVLGVSLDQPGKKAKWIDAIAADGLTWTQVSDLKFWENEAAQSYNVKSIPQNYLIDPAGKIVAKNLRGEALEQKLAELIK
ncbi:TlpA disulfide reductase family protein [Chitinophaga nivalis]|uniref:AhpC/TSA family protein n=1 Tax=Chitinophaga nivalis TaxID=2991709 RepID=A0ABT3IJ82_9BACT|nr:TlpA disulfide reductase family protein [Chitinophaga nivalis]MCW3466288.1 AhpC/TSA family protein [Chitinophaga nivalis]MCW3484021.1 AhpC/TSA family protein [Chitinophaga nivalis]